MWCHILFGLVTINQPVNQSTLEHFPKVMGVVRTVIENGVCVCLPHATSVLTHKVHKRELAALNISGYMIIQIWDTKYTGIGSNQNSSLHLFPSWQFRSSHHHCNGPLFSSTLVFYSLFLHAFSTIPYCPSWLSDDFIVHMIHTRHCCGLLSTLASTA